VTYDNSELRPEMLSQRDYAALREIERTRKHKFAWFLFGIADDVAAGAVAGISLSIGACFGVGMYVIAVTSDRGTPAMLAAALPPLALYGLLQVLPALGVVDFPSTRHPHLYPALCALGVVLASVIWWVILLVALT
jgi:hypothetical protein